MDRQVPNLYENSGYQFERRERKTLLLEVQDNVPNTYGTTPLTVAANKFSVKLHEPLIIDKLSDIYLDSFTTFDIHPNNTGADDARMGFILSIDQFNINTNSNNSNIFNKIFIPNDASAADRTYTHKGKKINYICSINPQKLHTISGNITDVNGGVAFPTTGDARFIAEFVIIARD